MRKTKLTSLLMAICCVFACLGIVTLVNQPKNVAKAANDFTITSTLTPVAAASSATHISAYPTDVSQKPAPACGWTETFTFVEGTGTGFTINDEPVTGYVIKQPNDFEIDLPSAAEAGDVLVLDGKFAGSLGNSITFTKCGLSFDGTNWAIHAVYTTHNAGVITNGSSQYPDHPTFWDLRLTNAVPAAGQEWTKWYHAQDDAVITLNGDPISFAEVKFPPDGSAMFVVFSQAPTSGDVLVVEGSFVCNELLYKVTIARSEIVFNGTTWTPVTPEEPGEPDPAYTTHNLGVMSINTPSMDGNAGTRPDHLYLKRADGNALPFTAWGNPFVLESGDGLKVNGDPVTIFEVQSAPEGFWLSFASADRGDIVTLSGSFVCSKQNLRYTIEESAFIWNGVVWADYDAELVYDEYEVGAVIFHQQYDGHPTFFDFALASGDQFPVSTEKAYENADEAWSYAYAVFSGVGIVVNGDEVVPTIKFPNQMFIEFANAPEEGDTLVIEGTFYNSSIAIKYTIARSEFVWNGSAYVDAFAHAKTQKVAELEAYFANFDADDYYSEEWEVMEEIVDNAKIAIDLAIDAEELATVVEDAKAELDEVQTKEEIAAIIGEKIDEAKAELDAYVDQDDYKATEWAEIQAIIAQAKADIEESSSPTAIDSIVADAKSAIDEVKTSAEVDAEALATAKTNAKKEINDYYGALNFEEYSDEANATLTTYVTEAKAAVDAATSVADVESIVAAFKADVDAVEKTQPSTKPSKGGCGASVASGMVTLVPVLALAVCMIVRKKEKSN